MCQSHSIRLSQPTPLDSNLLAKSLSQAHEIPHNIRSLRPIQSIVVDPSVSTQISVRMVALSVAFSSMTNLLSREDGAVGGLVLEGVPLANEEPLEVGRHF
jgi:hypothetical protein